MLLARIDEYGKAAWLGLVVLAFWAAWPLGLAVFAFLMLSGRARAWRDELRHTPGRWFNLRSGAGVSASRSSGAASRSSGNDAFDAYRVAELSQLEEQEKEFKGFLDRLRLARDKEEFDKFMAEQRRAIAEQPLAEQHGS